MPYTIPTSSDLKKFIKNLRAEYLALPNGYKNPERLKSIEKLEALCDKIPEVPDNGGDKVLTGAILFFAGSIQYTFGSSLVTLLEAGPHNTKDNQITDKQRMICLNEFFEFVNSNKIYLDFAEHKEDIVAFNKAKLKPITDKLAVNLKKDVDELFSRALTATLADRISQLPTEYKKQKLDNPPPYIATLWPFDYTKERNRCLAVTRILNAPFIDKLLPHFCKNEQSKEHFRQMYRRGFLIYLMKLLPTQCWKKSSLHDLVKQIFGTDDIKNIKEEEQNLAISNFRDFLTKALFSKEAMEELTKSGVFSHTTTADSYLKTMVLNIDRNFQGIMTPLVKTAAIVAAGAATQFAFSLQIAKAAKAVWDAGFGKGLMPIVLEELGAVVGGSTGRALGKYMGTVYEEAVMLAIYSRGIGLTVGQATSLFTDYDSTESKIAKRYQKYCVKLDRDVEQVIVKKEEWLAALEEEINWIKALHTFCPDEFKRLTTILEVSKKAKEKEAIKAKEVDKEVAPEPVRESPAPGR